MIYFGLFVLVYGLSWLTMLHSRLFTLTILGRNDVNESSNGGLIKWEGNLSFF